MKYPLQKVSNSKMKSWNKLYTKNLIEINNNLNTMQIPGIKTKSNDGQLHVSYIDSSNTSCEGYELHLKCSFGNAEKHQFRRNTNESSNRENTPTTRWYCPPVDDIREQQTLDQYLALAEEYQI
ncbi:hypothetical protein CEXT_434001 [Caerostris extrusa]|uniref:Uncharacterized protein n=1 Tax=Caerostris extrusa TaxID=172846 RepID=A0AAV4XYN7_CAEEX|nr:hypothetical protein CEXT_434001 [Caerostris extrusa]